MYLFIFGLVFGLVIQPLLDSFTSLIIAWVEAVKSKCGLTIAINNQKIENSISEPYMATIGFDVSGGEEVEDEDDDI